MEQNTIQPEAVALDAAPLDVVEIEPLEEPALDPSAPPAPVLMDKTKFFDFFASIFVVTGNVIGMAPPLMMPMQSLVKAPNLPGARPASDAIYEQAEKHDWLRWLIQEDADTVKSLVVIGAFGAQVAANVRSEMAHRRQLLITIEQQREFNPRSDEGGQTAGPTQNG